MYKVITTSQYNRPDYAKRMLNCITNSTDWYNYVLVVTLEPVNDELIQLFLDFDKCETDIHINSKILGCNQNTQKSIQRGFDCHYKPTHVLHVEDDILIGWDALNHYEDWVRSKENSATFGLYNRVKYEDFKYYQYNYIGYRQAFVPWGFGISRKTFEQAKEYNAFTMNEPYLSWDLRMNNMCRDLNLTNRYTFLSRVNNIGAVGGVHVISAEWHAANHHLPLWVNNYSSEGIVTNDEW